MKDKVTLVLGPEAFAVWGGRRTRVVSPTEGGDFNIYETQGPEVVALLHAFREPSTLESLPLWIRDAFGEQLGTAVGELCRLGFLVESRSDKSKTWERDGVEDLESMISLVEEIGWGLRGFGPSVDEAANDGPAIRTELRFLHACLAEIAGRLRMFRKTHALRQFQRVGLTPEGRNLQLHLGCGQIHLESWVNIDVDPAEFAWILQWGLPFAGSAAKYVYIGHVLEHLDYKQEALALLREIRRVLAPAGVARVVVPDIERFIRAYVTRDASFFESFEATWAESNPWLYEHPTPLAKVLRYAGAGSCRGPINGHRFGYDFETLKLLLEEAEFTDIRQSTYMGSAHPALRVDHSWAASANHADMPFALFVEAIVP